MPANLTVALVGLQSFYRDGISRLLQDQHYTIAELSAIAPDLILINALEGPTPTTIQVRALHASYPDAHIVLLNMAAPWTVPDILNCFRIGISAYLIQPSADVLLKTLELAALGELVVPREAVAMLSETEMSEPPMLSKREVEILRCLADGQSNKVIAKMFTLAEATVKVHVKAILRKLRLRNRTQAAVWGVRFLEELKAKEADQPAIKPNCFPRPVLVSTLYNPLED